MSNDRMEDKTAGSPLWAVRRLRAWYIPDRPILQDLEISLAHHEVVGLIGLNGAGKTTFLRTAAGLLSSFRLEEFLWNGKPASFRDLDVKLGRYMVFAEDTSFSHFTFREYLAYAAASYRLPVPDIRQLAAGFHFEPYTDVLMKELSAGNRKKAYLITAFSLRLPLLLLDEPVNSLDFQSTEYLYELINGYRQYGTILFSSHILESICLTSDRVLVLNQGRISRAFSGSDICPDTIREVLFH